jgi:hypothetical protein
LALAPILQAKQATESWGGQFVLLLLPDVQSLTKAKLPAYHAQLVSKLEAAGVSFIDTTKFFSRQPDPAALFHMRMSLHPNARGYVLLAEFLDAEFKKLPRPAPGVSSGF